MTDPTSARPDAPAVVWVLTDAFGNVWNTETRRADAQHRLDKLSESDRECGPFTIGAYARVPDVATLDAEIAALDALVWLVDDRMAELRQHLGEPRPSRDSERWLTRYAAHRAWLASLLARLRALREAVDTAGGKAPTEAQTEPGS